MGLEHYREDVEKLEESVESRVSRTRAYRMKMMLDQVMPFVILLIGFIVVFEFLLSISPAMARWISWANWALILYFAARLGVAYRLSTDHEQFVHQHWLDILLVVPAFSLMQEVRLASVAPALDDLPVFERGVLHSVRSGSKAENAAKLTRITRIIKRSA